MTYRTVYGFPTAVVVLVALLGLSGCSSQPPGDLGVQADGRLRLCPDRPNCVSSFDAVEDKTHYIAPLVAGPGEWSLLPQVITAHSSLKVVERQEHYLRVEATTQMLRFVDDLEFLFWPEPGLIHVRSASRLGYSDFGVNRERLEEIRQQLHLP